MLKRNKVLVILVCLFCVVLLSSVSFAAPGYQGARRGDVASASTGGEAGIPAVPTSGSGTSSQEYTLGVGDKIKLTVFGEADLSGEYEVGSNGVISLPLIGNVHAAGQSLHAFQQAVRSRLSEGYLKDPRVSAQVANYRPFFILGEVSKPGSYPYVNGMTVVNAVAMAGGYTYRADKGGITIVQASDPEKKDVAAKEDLTVMPGDVIRVPERFF